MTYQIPMQKNNFVPAVHAKNKFKFIYFRFGIIIRPFFHYCSHVDTRFLFVNNANISIN